MAQMVLCMQAHRDLVYQGRLVSRGEVFEMDIRAALQAARRGEASRVTRTKLQPTAPEATNPPVVAVALPADEPPIFTLDAPAETADISDVSEVEPAVDSFTDEPDDEAQEPSPRRKRRYRRRDLQADEA